MRKIKFRFWDVTLKKMCFRKPLTYDFSVKDIIPLQSIGREDKKGIEIFEADNFGWTLRISTANGSIICSSTIDYVHELQNLYFAITKNELVLRK